MENNGLPVIVNFGGGTNSAAIGVMAVRLGLRVDSFVFANTGAELPETYKFVWSFSAWLERHGLPGITVVQETRHGKPITLEEHALRTKRLPSKAYGRKSCSMKFKRDPIEKWIRANYPGPVVRVIGYDADEPQRARLPESERFFWSYPLIDWNMGREECAEVIMNAGLPLPGKSACFFCPSAREPEAAQLRQTHPDLFARALAIERNAEGLRGAVKGLGSNFAWASIDRAARLQLPILATRAPVDDCGCYDGARAADELLAPGYCGSFGSTLETGDGGSWPLARDWKTPNGPTWEQSPLFD